MARGLCRAATVWRYLIAQHELALKVGAIDAWTYLSYAAYTESDVALDDLSERLRRATTERDASVMSTLLRVASITSRPEIVDDLLDVLANWGDAETSLHAAIALGKVLDYTEIDRPDAVDLLRAIEWDGAETPKTRKAAWAALNRLEMYQLTERRSEYPSEFGAPGRFPRSLVDKSRQAKAYHLQRDPDAAGPDGCVPMYVHCGLAEWAIGD